MERIQSAIHKAREARTQNTHEPSVNGAATVVSSDLASNGNQPDLELVADQDVSVWTQLPKLVLKPRNLHRAHIVTDQAGIAAAPFDSLRTRILHQIRKNNWTRVAITAPKSACGKTTLCMNLAFALARQRDLRTMVVDLDMRKPAIYEKLGLREQLNFPGALRAASAPEDHMFCHDDNLIFALATKPTDNPAELLQEKETAGLFDEIEKRFKPDVILFDTAPMLACDDTYAFLDQIDGVLLIAAAESTTAEEIEKCRQEIETRSNLMGVVLNKCHHLNKEDTYGY